MKYSELRSRFYHFRDVFKTDIETSSIEQGIIHRRVKTRIDIK